MTCPKCNSTQVVCQQQMRTTRGMLLTMLCLACGETFKTTVS